MDRCSDCGFKNHPKCKTCKKKYNAQYRLTKRADNWAWYQDLKRRPCADCDRQFDPLAMDWDHRGNKIAAPANLMSKSASRGRILQEIEKCDLVCANCHRIRTYSRLKKWEYRPTELGGAIRDMKNRPCMDCDRSFPAEVMDFDHRDPSTKKYTIAHMKSLSFKFMAALVEEVAKCDLVCHCCHRLRTARKSQWQSSITTPAKV